MIIKICGIKNKETLICCENNKGLPSSNNKRNEYTKKNGNTTIRPATQIIFLSNILNIEKYIFD